MQGIEYNKKPIHRVSLHLANLRSFRQPQALSFITRNNKVNDSLELIQLSTPRGFLRTCYFDSMFAVNLLPTCYRIWIGLAWLFKAPLRQAVGTLSRWGVGASDPLL